MTAIFGAVSCVQSTRRLCQCGHILLNCFSMIFFQKRIINERIGVFIIVEVTIIQAKTSYLTAYGQEEV